MQMFRHLLLRQVRVYAPEADLLLGGLDLYRDLLENESLIHLDHGCSDDDDWDFGL